MAEGPDGKTIIIVKKVSGHGGHHGGAWKVAYADFVTAMMALFMVLWLVNSASVPTRERIASYFARPGIFEKGSGTPLEMGGAGILPDAFSPPSGGNSQVAPSKTIYDIETNGIFHDSFGRGEGVYEGEREEQKIEEGKKLEVIAREIKNAMAVVQGEGDGITPEAFTGFGNVEVKIDQRGLHIEIMDTPKASMFSVGAATMNQAAKDQLKEIGKILAKLPNPIDIEGHTDASPYRSKQAGDYDNWNLSVDRAIAARKALVESGVQGWQVARVVGYAEQRPKNPSDTFAPENRRISISMKYTEEAKTILQDRAIETTPEKRAPSEEKAEPKKSNVREVPLDIGSEVVPSRKNAQKSERLSVEVQTTAPEGEPMSEEGSDSQKPLDSGDLGLPEDVIFGDGNSFFGF